jgi:hypothetical protein
MPTKRGGDIHGFGKAPRKYAGEVAPTHEDVQREQVRIAEMLRELPVASPLYRRSSRTR